MDPAAFAELCKYGLGVAVLIAGVVWLSREFRDVRSKFDSRTDEMQKRCDEERKSLAQEIGKVRDAHSQDQRDLLKAAGIALSENAKAFGKLVEIHERREGSGQHPTRQS